MNSDAVEISSDAAGMTAHFKAFGGDNRITIAQVNGDPKSLLSRLYHEALRIQRKYSRYDSSSVVSLIGDAAGKSSVSIDSETAGLFAFADEAYRQSGGLFDLTTGVLRRVWNFREARVPAQSEVDRILPLIGWDKVKWSTTDVYLPMAGMEIDLGGIGKEYAVDRVAEMACEGGASSALVNFGGDILAVGTHPTGRRWSVGIQHPRKSNAVAEAVELEDEALATSGDYERFFIHDGVRYCHLLNPRSGYPGTSYASVSIRAQRCIVAGIVSSTAMLLPKAQVSSYLEGLGVSACAYSEEPRRFTWGAWPREGESVAVTK